MGKIIKNSKNNGKKILELWHYAEGLQRELRSGKLSNGRKESTAEHSWRVAFMVMIIAPKLKSRINVEKAIKMAIAHDIVEIEAKDVSSLVHSFNKDIKQMKEQKEELAIKNIKKRFGALTSEVEELWHEFEEQKTKEAKLVRALDKLDSRIRIIDDPETGDWLDGQKRKSIQLTKATMQLCSSNKILKELDELSDKERLRKHGF